MKNIFLKKTFPSIFFFDINIYTPISNNNLYIHNL